MSHQYNPDELRMNKRLNILIRLLNDELLLFLSISFGVFLFVLSFQPFPHGEFDFYYRLIFKVGLGAIVFLFMFLVRVLYPCLKGRVTHRENEITISSYASGIVIWVLSSMAFVCYLKYIGLVNISGSILYKVVLTCLVPPVVLLVSDRLRKLRMKNKSLISENELIQQKVNKNADDYMNLPIDFITGENGGKLSFKLGDLLFIKSANNYVEIHYLEEDEIKKKLSRNTLTNIELQVESYPGLIRCHRTCIVNTLYIQKMNGNCNNRTLTIKGYYKQIPVSRRYYLTVKEAV